jgi:lipocalin-like protein
MRLIMLAAFAAGIALSPHAVAADVSIPGTYRLVSEQRTIVDTNEVIPGTGARGYITYGEDGRVIVLIVRQPRPKPESAEKITDQQRIELFRTITAYAGTYKFDGTTIEHSIEISMNEVWSGTKQVRFVKRDGDRLIYSTPPFPFHTDGKMSVNTLVWEKVQ